ncbi:MAG: inorganic phosphate transporter [Elusimicrobia bacterium RIFOXYB2_FULL_49_7]|nr:MAG: inorganic phosphate transporter [Elusimicrobia bacterium RIFOXYB2_FULL_49_7]
MDTHTLVLIVVGLALLFDFLNGFHDAANSIATVVVSRTLTPFQAVLMSGSANFIGYFFFGLAVAKMVGKGVITIEAVPAPLLLLLATLTGACLWNILTWLLGLPTSSSHALIGGLIGSGIAAAGVKVVLWSGVLKIFAFIILAPLIGMVSAAVFTTLAIWISRKSHPQKSKKIFKRLQLISALFASVGHGTNDAQKTMGIIALALWVGGVSDSFKTGQIDNWVVLAAYSAISLGTVFGGWRIVKTMGTSITKIREFEGFCSGTASAFVLMGTSHFGIPVSTTHVISGSIMGIGAVQNAGKVRWVTARRIMWAWFLTIPATALCGALVYLIFVNMAG